MFWAQRLHIAGQSHQLSHTILQCPQPLTTNVNIKNKSRVTIFNNFCKVYSLIPTAINHTTYHHFLGDGLFDSNLDIIAHSEAIANPEIIQKIICKHEEPFVESHHDILLSSFSLPLYEFAKNLDNLIEAPKVPNKRIKVIWKDENIPKQENARYFVRTW